MWLVGMVNTSGMFDAEHCPDPIPTGYAAAMVYAGGSSAAHAWDAAERQRVRHLHNLPVWVPTPALDDPVADAQEFLAWLSSEGYPPIVDATGEHQAVMWDMETAGQADARWLNRACDEMAKAGYWNWPYGSAGTLFGLPARDGYVVAHFTGAPHMFLHPDARATQYAAEVATPGGPIDQSAIVNDALRQLRRLAV